MQEEKKILKKIFWYIFKLIVPLELFIAFFHKPETRTTELQLQDLESKIRDNDVLFSRVDWELSNFGIVGVYTHVAIYRNGMVYEAVTEGVRTISLREWFFKKDQVGLARCNMFRPSKLDLKNGLHFLDSCLGESYDYDFAKFTKKSQYCSAYWYAYMHTMFGSKFTQWFPKPLFWGILPVLFPTDCWKKLDKVVQYN